MFREISPHEIQDNPFTAIGKDWMLITAGSEESHNTMTASWGQLGVLWNRPVATIYIRPQRYTKEFVEQSARFSLSFLAREGTREALTLLGTKSGRDGDKIAEAGLHVQMLDGVPAFREARMVLVCKKLYTQPLLEGCFLEPGVSEAMYPAKDFHIAYTAEVEKVYLA